MPPRPTHRLVVCSQEGEAGLVFIQVVGIALVLPCRRSSRPNFSNLCVALLPDATVAAVLHVVLLLRVQAPTASQRKDCSIAALQHYPPVAARYSLPCESTRKNFTT